MGILRKLPAGLGARAEVVEVTESAAWATTEVPGKLAASRPPEAARNSLRSKAESLGEGSLGKDFDGLAGVGRHKNGGGEKAAFHPNLAGLGQAVTAKERQAEPTLLLGLVGHFFEGFARANSHGIVLRSYEIDGGLARCGEF